MQARLIIFCRYPEPGKAKTRLIPALGAEAAAALHQAMAEHTIRTVDGFQTGYPVDGYSVDSYSVDVEVRFAGGDLTSMQQWFGQDWIYTEQGGGDLGERMARSFHDSFTAGIQPVVIIGTDCPALDAAVLQQAFDTLQIHDLVLGPAVDGGYYLIGLQHPAPDLFINIAWSTAQVFSQTLAIAQTTGLSVAHLPTLSDVDTPDDLVIWKQFAMTYPQPQS